MNIQNRGNFMRPVFFTIIFFSFSCQLGKNPENSLVKDDSVGQPLEYSEYDVRFTNPICKLYSYGESQNVVDHTGERLSAKPKDAFCKWGDARESAQRPESPQSKMLEWIDLAEAKSIRFMYLSFSNSAVQQALCRAVTERGVKITFVLDRETNLTKAELLKQCTAPDGSNPELLLRGHDGGIGYAHNKLFIVDDGSDMIRIAFSSGNMSSGIVLHHENWHFVTLKKDTYFAMSHACLFEGVINASESKRVFSRFIKTCKDNIPHAEESDVKTFFVPGEGDRATRFISRSLAQSQKVGLAAHRLSYSTLLNLLNDRLNSDPSFQLNVVVDDDLYWAGQGPPIGPNTSHEYRKLQELIANRAQAKYMETNHQDFLLHHNKFMVFENEGQPQAVFAGAGNFTGTGFTSNFENFYFIEIPQVTSAFSQQFARLYGELATTAQGLPRGNPLPLDE
jgi:hypothetical protein